MIGLGRLEVAGPVVQTVGHEGPGRLLDSVGMELGLGILREPPHGLGEVAAPAVVGVLVVIDTDNSDVVGKVPRTGEVIERRHQQPLGQVAARAEDHERAGRRPRHVPVGVRPPMVRHGGVGHGDAIRTARPEGSRLVAVQLRPVKARSIALKPGEERLYSSVRTA